MKRRAKSNSLDGKLEALYALEQDPDSAARLPAFLRDKSNIVVSKAANMAARLELSALAGELAQVFLLIQKDAEKLDPGCVALTAVAKALVTFDAPAAEVYFIGIRHFQMAASFGRPVEVAAELRGLCARGIVRMGHPEALLEILPLLLDTVPARIGAVRAIAETGKAEAELLLRLHVLHGDSSEEVLGECFTALLGLIPQRSLEFVGNYLSSNRDEVAEMAALALGESRLTGAFPLLRGAWENAAAPSLRRAILFALAILRRDEALDFLLSLMETHEQDAPSIISALAIHKNDAKLRGRLAEKLKVRSSARLDLLFAQEWPD